MGMSDPQFTDLIIEGSGAYPQFSGRIFLNPQALFQSLQDELFFLAGQGCTLAGQTGLKIREILHLCNFL